MSSKPGNGINHKEFGVTSEGVAVYVAAALRDLSIDPSKDAFSVAITGGPDGDVGGNLLKILFRDCERASVVGVADGIWSGVESGPGTIPSDRLSFKGGGVESGLVPRSSRFKRRPRRYGRRGGPGRSRPRRAPAPRGGVGRHRVVLQIETRRQRRRGGRLGVARLDAEASEGRRLRALRRPARRPRGDPTGYIPPENVDGTFRRPCQS